MMTIFSMAGSFEKSAQTLAMPAPASRLGTTDRTPKKISTRPGCGTDQRELT